VDKALKKAFYIFLLGLGTYGWWKFTQSIKRKMDELGRNPEG